MIQIHCLIREQNVILHCPIGFSLMQCLKMEDNNEKICQLVDNIAATCGGNMSCSTCMVRISSPWIPIVLNDSILTPEENIFIDMFLDQNSIENYQEGQYRLSCQIKITSALNHLKIIFIMDNYY